MFLYDAAFFCSPSGLWLAKAGQLVSARGRELALHFTCPRSLLIYSAHTHSTKHGRALDDDDRRGGSRISRETFLSFFTLPSFCRGSSRSSRRRVQMQERRLKFGGVCAARERARTPRHKPRWRCWGGGAAHSAAGEKGVKPDRLHKNHREGGQFSLWCVQGCVCVCAVRVVQQRVLFQKLGGGRGDGSRGDKKGGGRVRKKKRLGNCWRFKNHPPGGYKKEGMGVGGWVVGPLSLSLSLSRALAHTLSHFYKKKPLLYLEPPCRHHSKSCSHPSIQPTIIYHHHPSPNTPPHARSASICVTLSTV